MMQRDPLFCFVHPGDFSWVINLQGIQSTSVRFSSCYTPNPFILTLLAGALLVIRLFGYRAVSPSLCVQRKWYIWSHMINIYHISLFPQGYHENNDVCEMLATLQTTHQPPLSPILTSRRHTCTHTPTTYTVSYSHSLTQGSVLAAVLCCCMLVCAHVLAEAAVMRR